MRTGYWDSTKHHAWLGTNECLRDVYGCCANNRTGCLFNDGHDRCTHKAAYKLSSKGYDSPLRRRTKP